MSGTNINDVREQSSMKTWWPRLKPLQVPTPTTVEVPGREGRMDLGTLPNGDPDYLTCHVPDGMERIRDAIVEVGGPDAFLRTDQASNKHDMDNGSRLTSLDMDHVESHVWNVISHNKSAGFVGLPYDRFYVREWLDLHHPFTAFNGTPIAPEIRFFIYDGDIHSSGFYWERQALLDVSQDDWERTHTELKEYTFEDDRYDRAVQHVRSVADEFSDGYWSVDFALTSDDEWYCIDMARGVASHHPPECEKPAALQ